MESPDLRITEEPPTASDPRESTPTETAARPGRRSKALHRGPVNAIAQTRTHRERPEEPARTAAAAEGGAPTPASQAPTSAPAAPAPSAAPTANADRADFDPWTIPESVRDRFAQVGQRYYFPDGAPAFRDLGRRLTTPSENTQVVASLIEIAHSRGWTEITVSGTERFRQEAWRQARMAGLDVRGYRPSDIEQAQVIRAIAHKLGVPADRRTDEISAEARPSESRAPSGAPPTAETSAPPARAPNAPRERIAGRLLDHGRDAYRHDPQHEMSYFVRVETRDGKREVWGKDLERAMSKSLTQPQIGDEVILQKTGRDAVTVKRAERDASGELQPKELETHRNRWVVEKREFFDERARAAQVIRDATIDPRTAVRQHPQLAGTYMNLKAAELAAQRLSNPDDRRRFVALVRGVLADDIELGAPLQPVYLRERRPPSRGHAAREAEQPTR
jgi:putative DNA primase/helicase